MSLSRKTARTALYVHGGLMPAPKRLKIDWGSFSVSAFMLHDMTQDQANSAVCRTCAPIGTKLEKVCTLHVLTRTSENVLQVMHCRACGNDWAVPLTNSELVAK